MTATILNGKKLAQAIREKLKLEISKLTTDNNKYFLSSMKDKTVKTANCRISENFFNDRGFALYGTFDFYNPLPRYQNYVRIYKNILEKN